MDALLDAGGSHIVATIVGFVIFIFFQGKLAEAELYEAFPLGARLLELEPMHGYVNDVV